MPATKRDHLRSRHQPWHQRQRNSKVDAAYRDQPPAVLSAFIPMKSTPKRQTEMSAVIDLLFGDQSITVKWPTSYPEGCARFVRWLTQ